MGCVVHAHDMVWHCDLLRIVGMVGRCAAGMASCPSAWLVWWAEVRRGVWLVWQRPPPPPLRAELLLCVDIQHSPAQPAKEARAAQGGHGEGWRVRAAQGGHGVGWRVRAAQGGHRVGWRVRGVMGWVGG